MKNYNNINWENLAKEYLETGISLTKMSQKYEIGRWTLTDRFKKLGINIVNKQNELKKLLEKNLRNIIPNNSLNFNPKKIFAEGVMESFCYFKILEKDSPKFNPLESCAISPESLVYSE